MDVFCFKIGIFSENSDCIHPIGDEINDQRHRDAHAPDASLSPQNLWVGGDAIKTKHGLLFSCASTDLAHLLYSYTAMFCHFNEGLQVELPITETLHNIAKLGRGRDTIGPAVSSPPLRYAT